MPPTPKQLAYLKALARRTATTFAYPQSRGEASREIHRLHQLPVAHFEDRSAVDTAVESSSAR